MAYITKEEVKEKRDLLKKEFPSSKGWKFSVTKEHYSSINVVITESPFNLLEADKKYCRVDTKNSIKLSYEGRVPVITALEKILNIVNKGNFDHSDSMTDYFHVGFYANISVGSYDKPFKWNKQSIRKDV